MPSGRAALSWGFGASLALHALWIACAPQLRPHVKRSAPAQRVELEIVRLPLRAADPQRETDARAAVLGARLADGAPPGSTDPQRAADALAALRSTDKPRRVADAPADWASPRSSDTFAAVRDGQLAGPPPPGSTDPQRALDTPAAASGAQPANASQLMAAAPARRPRKQPRHDTPQPPRETASTSPPLPAAADLGRDLSALERTLKQIAATTELSPDQRRKAMLVVLRTWEDPSRNESAEQLIDTLLLALHPGEDR